MKTQTAATPSPMTLFLALNAYHRTAAIKGAIELDLFTAIAEGNTTVAQIAKHCGASERGVRILCDFLVVDGFLTRSGDHYALTQDSAVFLDRHSPAYLGGMVRFLTHPEYSKAYSDIAEVVRRGTTLLPDGGSVKVENDLWVAFADGMANMMVPAAQRIAELIGADQNKAMEVLDIAAGHGVFGVTIAQQNKNAKITALDWPAVLEVAGKRAQSAGVGDRYRTLPGDFFKTELGGPYDVVLVTNFYHHFDLETCASIARKVKAALKPGGKMVTLEFVPNDDRISPPVPATFSLVMLASTPSGNAYTFAEFERMFRAAGFGQTTRQEVMPGHPETILVAQ